MRHLAISIALVASLSATGCGASLRNQASHGKLQAVAVDPKIEKDINLGFASYETVLTRWGRWEQDEWYGVRWCPDPKHTPVKFVPYKSRGHWTASTKPIAQAPAGSPYWVSDDSETWGEITMHHGYWVNIDTRTPSWCWIPGVEETAGRVVWRTGEGFVGWAPEPPVWVDDGGEGVIANLLWNFVFLGALLENDLEPQYLEGDAYGAAVASSSPVRATRDAYAPARPNVNGEGGERVPANPTVGNAMRVGPPMAKVAEARLVLAGYASTHEGKLPAGGLGGSEGVKTGASGSAAPDKGTSTSKKDEKLPSGVVVYTSLSTMPMIGPAGITPRYYRVESEPYATTIEPASRPSSSSSSSSSSSPSYASPSFASTPSYSSPHSSASSSSSSSSSSRSSSSSSQGSSYSPASSSRSTSASSSSSSHGSSFRGGGSRSSR